MERARGKFVMILAKKDKKMWVSIGKIAKLYAVCCQTIRNWEKEGMFEVKRTFGGHRRFKLEENSSEEKKTICYARVSSNDQKQDLARQVKELEQYCEQKEINNIEIVKDIGSGINYKKRGLRKLIREILEDKIARLIINFKDRLLRFGTELIEQLCILRNIEIIIINDCEEKSFERELVEDVLAILTVFSSKIYGRRSHKTRIRKFSEN